MSMITRCPACSTVFKVVADQLKVSGGWVRCGHCSEVFDAQAYLQTDAESPALAESPGAASVASVAPLAPIVPISPGLPIGPELLSEPFARPPKEAAQEATPKELPPAEPDSALDSALDSPADSSLLGPPSVLPDVSFVRKAQAQAFWRRPAVRNMLAVLCLALLGALAVQVAVFERNRIAALQPAAKPWLQQLCVYAGCEITPLRQIDALVIDSSAFNKLRPDTYRLSVAIKNTGPLELAMPSLELALTDTLDRPVLRRVLTPAELGATQTLAANGEFAGGVTLQVDKAAGPAIAGYRVLAFYP